MKAEVSVVIPTRDREAWLPRALLSAISQRDVTTEVIVVDDGSASPMADRLTDKVRSQVTVIRNELPKGVAAARNLGIEAAAADWIAFLDDDDLWAPAKLRRLRDLALGSGSGLAFSGGVSIDGQGALIDSFEPPVKGPDLHRALLAANVIPFTCSNIVARTDLVRSIGGFDERLIHLADWDLSIRLSEVARAVATEDHLIAYTLHSENLHLTEAMLAEDLRLFNEKYENKRSELEVSFDRSLWLTWRSPAQRRAGHYRRAAIGNLELAWRRRDPILMAKSLAVSVGGKWAIRARHGIRALGDRSREDLHPAWLEGAVRPTPSALSAVWR